MCADEGSVHVSKALIVVLALLTLAAPARADVTVRAAFGVGGVRVLNRQRLALSPSLALDWRSSADSPITLGVREEFAFMPSAMGVGDKSVSLHSRTAGMIGLAWPRFSISLGPTLAIYSMSVCSPTLCAWTSGAAPGVDAQATLYTTEWLGGIVGIQASGYVGWYDNNSVVLTRAVIGIATIGTVIRFGNRR